MKIALDAMGGDFAPGAVVEGAVAAAPLVDGEIFLVGHPDHLQTHIKSELPKNISIAKATEWIGMDEKPTEALRKKKDASILVAADLVKSGEAQSLVSAGNTGAVTAAALLRWRQIEGVHRPAIVSIFPSIGKPFLLLDAGASPDVDPIHLLEFALMGRAYAEKVLLRSNPIVHLVNIGEEEGKGNNFTKAAYSHLKGRPWFAGNIEGKDMFHGNCDVVVCDAFVGNVCLKLAEGIAEFVVNEVKSAIPKGPARFLYAPVEKVMAPLRKKMDYAEYGGSPLLGLNGNCVICHGRSNAKAIKNALLLAARAAENDLVDATRRSFAQEKELISHP